MVELKEILSKAQVSLTGKANKADLIAKILASPEALAVAEGPSNETSSVNAAPTAQPEPVSALQFIRHSATHISSLGSYIFRRK